MLFGPVEQVLKSIGNSSTWITEKRIWIKIHEIEHMFLEGGEMLANMGVFSQESLALIRRRVSCLDEANLNARNTPLVESTMMEAVKVYQKEDYKAVGFLFSTTAYRLCNDEEFVAT